MPTKQVSDTARKPPAAGKGRPKGSVNKTTGALKEAIIAAAEAVGQDGSGKDGLTGYLKHVAASDVKAFASLLGKVLPLQLAHSGSIDLVSKDQRDAAVAAATRADR